MIAITTDPARGAAAADDLLAAGAGWEPVDSGMASLALAREVDGAPGLRMDFDFRGGRGFVIARRRIHRAMPGDFTLCLRLRGPMSGHRLEIKLFDLSGESAWWHVVERMQLWNRWRRLRLSRRDFEFAWGPAAGARLTELGSIEIAVVAGSGGGGTLCIDELAVIDDAASPPAVALASSEASGHEAAASLDGRGWQPLPVDRNPWLRLDLQAPRTLGGVVLEWTPEAPADGYVLRGSLDGKRWPVLHRAERAAGRCSWVAFPHRRLRYLRLETPATAGAVVVRTQDTDFSSSPSAFWHAVAAANPRGWFPRWLLREQSLWTPAAVPGRPSALINEDGLVEPMPGSFSLEPMLWSGGRLTTWSEVAPVQRLEQGWMPVPTVTWEAGALRLDISLEGLADGAARIVYRLSNGGGTPRRARLLVVLRPFQVTPPWQAFFGYGGLSRIRRIRREGRTAWIDAKYRVDADRDPAAFGASAFDQGPIAAVLADGRIPPGQQVRDPLGYATAVMAFDCELGGGDSVVVATLVCSTADRDRQAAGPFRWSERLPVEQIEAPAAADALRARLTACAHILVNRCGPALHPGPRRYARSWIRDAAVMGSVLLRAGCQAEVAEFLRWYAGYQRADGFVPCCVDARGVEWRTEHDSHGEFIALAAEYCAISGDRQAQAELFPAVARAADFIERTLDAQGLMPPSESHEGYSGNPVHAYWDDFWALRGLVDAQAMAQGLGHGADVGRWRQAAERLERGLYGSIAEVRRRRGLDYIPASSDLGDFDPMATAGALALLDVPAALDRVALERTFDLYLENWRCRYTGAVQWSKYTPYEIRVITALVRLGRRQDALQMLGFALDERRPAGWNQWPEIAWREARAPGHVGDIPHAWIGAEFALAVESLFAYQRGPGGPLVLAAGVAPAWIEGEGVRLRRLPTPCGPLSYKLRRRDATSLRCEIEAMAGEVILRPPLDGGIAAVEVDGQPWSRFDRTGVTLAAGAREVLIIMERP